MVTNYATYSNPDKLEQDSLNKELGANSPYLNQNNNVSGGIDLTNKATADTFMSNYNKFSSKTVTGADLANSSNITLPPPVVNNTNTDSLTNIGLTSTEQADVDLKQSEKDLANTNKPESVKDGYIAKFLGLNTTLAGKADETAKLQEEQQLAEKTKAANEINKRILTTSRAYEKQIRERQKNLSGTFGGATTQDIKNIERARDEQLADLSIQKAVALGDIDTANKIVETAIAAKYDPIQSQLDNYEKLISFAQNDMTESEKFEAQNKLNLAKEELDTNRSLQSAIINDANQNGDTRTSSAALKLDPSSPTFKSDLANIQAQMVIKNTSGTEMTTRQNIVYNNLVTKYSAIDKANSTFEVVNSTAEALKKDPKNAQLQLSTLYQFVKVLDSNSAVREGETKLAKDTASFYNRVQANIQGIIDGTVTGSDVAIKMAEEAQRLANDWINASASQKTLLQAQAKGNQIEDIYLDTIGYANELEGTMNNNQEQSNNISSDGLSNDDAYNEYLKATGAKTETEKTTTEKKPYTMSTQFPSYESPKFNFFK